LTLRKNRPDAAAACGDLNVNVDSAVSIERDIGMIATLGHSAGWAGLLWLLNSPPVAEVRGASPYLPLNLSSQIERPIERA
jgi:hypothetical protein